MTQITIDIPDDALAAIKSLPLKGQEIGDGLRLLASLKLYEMGRLSSGAAAKMAGVPRTVFLSRLADFGLDTFTLSRDDLLGEVRIAEDHL